MPDFNDMHGIDLHCCDQCCAWYDVMRRHANKCQDWQGLVVKNQCEKDETTDIRTSSALVWFFTSAICLRYWKMCIHVQLSKCCSRQSNPVVRYSNLWYVPTYAYCTNIVCIDSCAIVICLGVFVEVPQLNRWPWEGAYSWDMLLSPSISAPMTNLV